jgi:hypothetical protein
MLKRAAILIFVVTLFLKGAALVDSPALLDQPDWILPVNGRGVLLFAMFLELGCLYAIWA